MAANAHYFLAVPLPDDLKKMLAECQEQQIGRAHV